MKLHWVSPSTLAGGWVSPFSGYGFTHLLSPKHFSTGHARDLICNIVHAEHLLYHWSTWPLCKRKSGDQYEEKVCAPCTCPELLMARNSWLMLLVTNEMPTHFNWGKKYTSLFHYIVVLFWILLLWFLVCSLHDPTVLDFVPRLPSCLSLCHLLIYASVWPCFNRNCNSQIPS